MKHTMNTKVYELSNHLGNVLVTVADARQTNNGTGSQSGTVVSYSAIVVSANDYSAFGAPMAGRTYSSPSYRYGFNGKEKVDEVHGNSGDAYDFGKRVYDGRLGRWFSTDPYEAKYAHTSPYTFALNSPISLKDIAGDTATYICYYQQINLNTGITLTYKWIQAYPDQGPADGNIDGGYIYKYTQTYKGNFDNGCYQIAYDEARMDKLNLDAIMTPATIRGMEYVPFGIANEETWSPYGGAAGVQAQQKVSNGASTTTYTQNANINEYGYGGDNTKGEATCTKETTATNGVVGVDASIKAYMELDLHKATGKTKTIEYGLPEGYGLEITIDSEGIQQIEINVGISISDLFTDPPAGGHTPANPQ
jgi:RHS repeat-associated protein